jgi:hypothetical protein
LRAIAVIDDGIVADSAGWRAVIAATIPAVRVGSADHVSRTVADRIIAVEIGIVVSTAGVVVVAAGIRIVCPTGISRAHEK